MYRITAAALALALTLPAAAAEKFDPESLAKAIAPFLDEQTLGVAHLDLTRIDTDALLDKLAEAGKLEAGEIAETKRELRGWLAGLTRAGGKELYVVFSLADLPTQPPFVVVPLGAGADAKEISRELGRGPLLERQPFRFETLGRAVVGAGESTLKRLRPLKPAPRPELDKAFAAAGDTAGQALLLPPAETRRVLDELLPALPPELGGGSSKPLTAGLRWAALGVEGPPKLAVRLVIQSPDPAAARALADLLTGAVKALGRQKEVRAWLPEFDKVTAPLTPRVEEGRLIVALGEKEVLQVLPPLVRRVHQAEVDRAGLASLKELANAAINYADAHKGRLPAVANFDRQGKPLLSWRVHLLPYLGEKKLYQEFHLDEPWDSAHNKELIARMPRVYQGRGQKLNREGKTIYLAPVGENVAFTGGPEGLRFPADFTDGTANTILLVEADDDHAVVWTRPADLKYDPEQPHKGLGGHFEGGFLAALADGSAHFIRKTVSKKTLQNAFTRNDGEPLGSDWE
jgi:hypothetical protein